MAKNDAVLLDGILSDRMALEPLGLGDTFELFAFEQILKSYDLTRQELDYGWVDGRDDGGIDGFFTFVNGAMVQDPAKFHWPKKGVSIDVFIISCKHKDSFQQEPLNTLFPTIEELLDYEKAPEDFDGQYSAQVIRAREIAVQAFRRTASALPKLHFRVAYASRGDQVEINIDARGRQLRRIVSDYFSDAEVQLDYVGATELIALHRKTGSILELPYAEQLAGEQGAYVLLVRLSAYAKFVSDEKGSLKRYLFDSNVRDFLGENRVNQEIANSLADVTSPDFWWLNNGVTILATSAIPLGKTAAGNALQLHDVQIVNGLQTTQTIQSYLSSYSGGVNDSRSVLIKVIVSDDTVVRDKIIRATNNQSSVELASLTATDKIQRDIEAILEANDWFYERRRNYYKNIGKPVERFIVPLFLAVSMVALVRKAPQLSARLKSRFMQDSLSYEAVFTEKLPIVIWPKLASVMKCVDAVISSKVPTQKVGPRIVAGWRGATALCTVSEIFRTFEYSVQNLIELDENLISTKRVGEIFEFLTKPRAEVRPDRIRSVAQRARVELRCEEFATLLSLAGAEVIGKWQLPSSREDTLSKAVDVKKIDPMTVVPKLPERIASEILEKIFSVLPPQPWKPGMQQRVAAELDVTPKLVQLAVKELILAERCNRQFDGVVIDKNGFVLALDTARAAPHHKLGQPFLREPRVA